MQASLKCRYVRGKIILGSFNEWQEICCVILICGYPNYCVLRIWLSDLVEGTNLNSNN